MTKKLVQLIVTYLLIILFINCTIDKPDPVPINKEDAGTYDIVIANGLVYDGSGLAPAQTDIGIMDGHIVKVGTRLNKEGAIIIDAGDLIVAPGFIDIHTHCDGQVLKDGMNNVKNYLTQGVTTVVTGNCGSGTYKVDEFFNEIESRGVGTNIVHLIGHGTIRSKVMGGTDREPTVTELEKMKNLAISGMEAGAAGISTGLFYVPGAYSSTDELIELAKTARQYGGFYATHMRDESNYSVGLIEAVKEAISIGEQAGIRVEISHIKALGKPVWNMSSEVCNLIEEAQNRGITIFADQYPYNASNTGLSDAVVPVWARSGGRLEQRLNDPQLSSQIKDEITKNIERRGGPESLVIVSYPKDRRFDGKNLSEISNLISKTLVETVIFLVLDGNPSIISFNMLDEDIISFMKKDYVMTCSDGSIVKPGNGMPHPRCYGTFPRKIRKYVLEDKVIPMEKAIKAATSMPANMIGLKDRGYIKTGQVADIVVFNPETISDDATFNDPHHYSTGIEYLLINGDIVISGGQYNEKLSGKPIKLIQAKKPVNSL